MAPLCILPPVAAASGGSRGVQGDRVVRRGPRDAAGPQLPGPPPPPPPIHSGRGAPACGLGRRAAATAPGAGTVGVSGQYVTRPGPRSRARRSPRPRCEQRPRMYAVDPQVCTRTHACISTHTHTSGAAPACAGPVRPAQRCGRRPAPAAAALPAYHAAGNLS